MSCQLLSMETFVVRWELSTKTGEGNSKQRVGFVQERVRDTTQLARDGCAHVEIETSLQM
jgi:hypothetical protein